MSKVVLALHGQMTEVHVARGPIDGTLDVTVGDKTLTVEQSIRLGLLIEELEAFIRPSTVTALAQEGK